MRCPNCKIEFSPEVSTAKPFCSERCRLIDLGHWLDETYTLPEAPDPEADETPDDNWAGESLTDIKITGSEKMADAEEPTDV